MRFPNYDSSIGTLKLGSFAGTPVLLHWGIVVPAALLTSSYWLRGRLLLGLLVALILFGSFVWERIHCQTPSVLGSVGALDTVKSRTPAGGRVTISVAGLVLVPGL